MSANPDAFNTAARLRDLDRRERRDDNARLAYQLALAEFLEAVEIGPLTLVSMPRDAQMPAASALFELADMGELLGILQASISLANTATKLEGQQAHELRHSAHQLINLCAHLYALNFERVLGDAGAFDE